MGDNYYIVQAETTHGLEQQVEKLFERGWRPNGAPQFVPTVGAVMGGGIWYQAMVKSVDHLSFSYSSSSTNVFPEVIPIAQPGKKKKSPPPA